MRFLHLADLHLGKSIHGVSLLEDQACWAERFLERTDALRPDAVVIAGDVYDRSAPSGDAVELLSRLLTALSARSIPVLLVAGNHDSVQRLAFARPLLEHEGVYISRSLGDAPELVHVTLHDAFGPVTFWLMPYVYPALIAQALGEDSFRDSDAAVRALLARQPLDPAQRNVLVAHQNVTAGGVEGLRGGSETMVGGVGQIDCSAFDSFDYVALGHIHAAYPVGRECVRYAGSPLCYHFDETHQPEKGPLLVTLEEKGTQPHIERQHIEPLHPMRELRGSYAALRDAALADPGRGEYLRLVLTDQRVTPEVAAFFRELFTGRDSVLMELESAYTPFRGEAAGLSTRAVKEKSVEELFSDFYTERSGGIPPTERDAQLLHFAGERLRAAEVHTAPDEREIAALLAFLTEQEGRA
ncbi:MAG: exonuclease SbcCD subunit D [Eubacteriales bacterium]|nr:exonuclease SbcCD subunit D [Eubacteriales bacterium]